MQLVLFLFFLFQCAAFSLYAIDVHSYSTMPSCPAKRGCKGTLQDKCSAQLYKDKTIDSILNPYDTTTSFPGLREEAIKLFEKNNVHVFGIVSCCANDSYLHSAKSEVSDTETLFKCPNEINKEVFLSSIYDMQNLLEQNIGLHYRSSMSISNIFKNLFKKTEYHATSIIFSDKKDYTLQCGKGVIIEWNSNDEIYYFGPSNEKNKFAIRIIDKNYAPDRAIVLLSPYAYKALVLDAPPKDHEDPRGIALYLKKKVEKFQDSKEVNIAQSILKKITSKLSEEDQQNSCSMIIIFPNSDKQKNPRNSVHVAPNTHAQPIPHLSLSSKLNRLSAFTGINLLYLTFAQWDKIKEKLQNWWNQKTSIEQNLKSHSPEKTKHKS